MIISDQHLTKMIHICFTSHSLYCLPQGVGTNTADLFSTMNIRNKLVVGNE